MPWKGDKSDESANCLTWVLEHSSEGDAPEGVATGPIAKLEINRLTQKAVLTVGETEIDLRSEEQLHAELRQNDLEEIVGMDRALLTGIFMFLGQRE